jgi:hypothetical protein
MLREEMMSMITRRAAGALGLSLVLMVSAALAQAPTRIRGAIEKVDGQTLGIKSRDGQDLTVKLAPNAMIVALIKASLADIKQGSFVGITSLPGEGTWRAIEIHIFPEAMRGTGEGDRPWDLMPQSTMTNATVSDIVAKVQGHTLTLKFKEGEKTFAVTPETVIVTYVPGDKAELKPGKKIFVPAAVKQADGTYETQRVNIGRDVDPPM